MKIINYTSYSKFTLRSLAREVWARAITSKGWWETGTIAFRATGRLDYVVVRTARTIGGPCLDIYLPNSSVQTEKVAQILWVAMLASANMDIPRTDFGFISLRFGPALVERQPKVDTPEEAARKGLARIGKSIARAEKTVKWHSTHLKTLRKKEAALQKRLDACRKVE